MATRRNDLMGLVSAALRQGWKKKDTKSGCLLFSPDGNGIVPIHLTPSGSRYWRNKLAELSKYGFLI